MTPKEACPGTAVRALTMAVVKPYLNTYIRFSQRAKPMDSGIYNGIILAVELRTVPGPLSQKEILGAFFAHSHNYVVEEYVI